jgi:hypothetical protein
LLAVGLALAIVFIGWAYFTAPPDYAHSQGNSDGQMFLGRWWEPFFAVFLAGVGYLCWAAGTMAGLLVNAVLSLRRPVWDGGANHTTRG